MADIKETTTAETTPEVVETPKEAVAEKEATPEVVEVEEATNGHKNGNGKAANGDSENGHSNGNGKAANGDAKEEEAEETKNGKNGDDTNGAAKEETNGDATEDKEATKRKAEDDPIEEIPVSAEKIAKLKESEVPAAAEVTETPAEAAEATA